MNGTQVRLVAAREYLENVRTRGFWISAISMPILFLLFSIVPALLADSTGVARFAVVDQSGWVARATAERILGQDVTHVVERIAATDFDANAGLADAVRRLKPEVTDESARHAFIETATTLIARLRREGAQVRDPKLPLEIFADWWMRDLDAVIDFAPEVSRARFRQMAVQQRDRATLNHRLEEESLLGYFVIPEDPVRNADGATYVTRNLTNRDLQRWYAGHVTAVVRGQRIREENIAAKTATWIQEPVAFAATRITAAGEETEAELSDTLAQWAPVGFVYLLWISVFSVTQMLLTNTIEEKSNKLVEVLLSSLAPIDLMAGKILGICATGMTLIGVWLATLIMIVFWLPTLLGAGTSLDLTPLVDNPVYIGSFVVYFLLGYLFYAALLCGLGALCSSLKEAQNLAMPVQFLLLVPLFVMIPIGRDPNGTLAAVMSWIPPFTPFVMLNRSAFPPDWSVYVGTTALMVVSIWLALRLAARLFETGILMTGKAPRLRQLLRMVRGKSLGNARGNDAKAIATHTSTPDSTGPSSRASADTRERPAQSTTRSP